MNKNRASSVWFTSVAALSGVVIVGPSPVAAQEVAAAEEGAPLAWSGFVDFSSGIPLDGYAPGSRGVSLGLDQLELDLEANPSGDLSARADLNVFPTAGELTGDALVEQAFATWKPAGGGGFSLAFGKRNAPIGVESIDPVDMYQYSSGLLFKYATPSNLTGAFVGWERGDTAALLFTSADWDQPTTRGAVLTGGRVSQNLGKASVGLSSTYGPLPTEDDGESQLMVDLDAKVEAGAATIWLELNYGTLGDLESTGALGAVNYAFSDSSSATLRGDWLDRKFGTEVKQYDVTIAFLHALTPQLGATVEVKRETPDEGDALLTGAVELTAKF